MRTDERADVGAPTTGERSTARTRVPPAFAWAMACGLAVTYGLLVPKGRLAKIDHDAYLEVLARMRRGTGYYDAMRDTFFDQVGVRLGGPRSYRTPYLFLVLEHIPADLLYATFLAVVVAGTSVILARATPYPVAVLPVTIFLLHAGRTPADVSVESWLLVEFWTVPLLAISYAAWRSERDWLAALAASGAVLIRELALPVVIVGLVLAHRRNRSKEPWLVALGVAVAGWAVHIVLALEVGASDGNEARLWGTGAPPGTVLDMLLYMLPVAGGVALVVWCLAGVRILQAGIPGPVVGVLVIPVAGLFVNRSYWGILASPFVILWAGEAVGDLIRRARSRHRTVPPGPWDDREALSSAP